MTIQEIHDLNEAFQKGAVQLSDLIPSGSLSGATAAMIRASRKMDKQFESLVKASSVQKFHRALDHLEEEMDELLFLLDQLDIANKSNQISLISAFVKDGYNLVAIYSRCCDLIIGKQVKEEE